MEEQFRLNHFALYSKRWYKKFDKKGRGKNKTIWDDLRCVLTADGYCGDLMTKYDIVQIIVRHSTRLKHYPFREPITMLIGITDKEIWKCGYYTKTNCDWVKKDKEFLPDYDYWEAIIYYCMSAVCNCEIKYLPIGLVKPDYKKCLPRRNGISNKIIKEFFSENNK